MEQIGRYQIVGELGRGAMGVVYRAQDPAIGRTVAIKTIRLSELTEPGERERLRERLLREAQSAGVLSHPGIVTIYDIQDSGDLAYVFMEFVDGSSLDKLLGAENRPDRDAMLDILHQTAAAVDYAHSRGIVHRDIKPANIMIHRDAPTGRLYAKITDFGVARIVSQQRTQSGLIMGTPSYMSPEQIQGHPVDGRADQFALAVIAYELLTGEKPFASDESLATTLFRIVTEEPVPPQRLNPTLGAAVTAVLERALAKEPAARYESCIDFVTALERALADSPAWVMLSPGAGLNMPTVAATTVTVARAAPKRIEKAPPAPPAAPGDEPTITLPVELPKPAPEPPAPAPVASAPAPVASAPAPPPARKDPIDLPPARPPRAGREPSRSRFAVLGAFAIAGFLVAGGVFWYAMGPDEQAPPAPPPAAESKPEPERAAEPPPAAESKPEPARQPEPPPQTAAKEPPAAAAAPTPQPARPPAPLTGQFDVEFYSSPSGATIVVDGRSDLTCKTPCGLPFHPGRHTLAATLPGHRRAMKIFDVPSDRSVAVGLIPMTGTVMVKTIPAGATIFVDGREWKSKTPTVITLPVGRRRLEFVLEGYPKEEHMVEVRDAVMTNLDINWNRTQ